jgi:hypothetical protein
MQAGTLERKTMVEKRKAGRPKTSERDDISVKLDRAIVGMAKNVATRKGVPVAELLSEMLRVPVGRAYAQMLRELEGEGTS